MFNYLLKSSATFDVNGVVFRLANESSASWTLVYEFVSDRLRAVRQDMIIQRMSPSDTLLLLEAMIPFYLVAEYRY